MNLLTDDTKAILLLCGYFSKDAKARPLTVPEYNKLVRWMIREDVKLRPADLLQEANAGRAEQEVGFEPDRLHYLLGRGVQLGFSLEEWGSAGIWVLSRSDAEYPRRYKEHLREKAPPILFGTGNKSLLQGGGLAVVGSRNVDGEGEKFTREVAEQCARNHMTIVSGGARGVDQVSMSSAFQAGGCVIGVLAENLLKKSVQRENRQALADDRLLLISPYHPKASFSVGTAMGRNKLIYAMADYGLVVSSDYNKGGTWTGAKEELRRENAIPVFVRMSGKVPAGNQKLLELGAKVWPALAADARPQDVLAESAKAPVAPPSLFDDQRALTPSAGALPMSVPKASAPKAQQGELFEAVHEATASSAFKSSGANLGWTPPRKKPQ